MKHPRQNPNQFTKIGTFAIESQWASQSANIWTADVKPVLREPQGDWAVAANNATQTLYWVGTAEPTSDQDDWVQAFWDSQSGRWVAMHSGSGNNCNPITQLEFTATHLVATFCDGTTTNIAELKTDCGNGGGGPNPV